MRVLVAEGIRDERVLAAFRSVPRASFVPPELVGEAYVDVPLPIPRRQVTTQPSLVARMLEALELTGAERVLEVGTGYGFQTALLAHLAAAVWSVERFVDLAGFARAALAARGIRNAWVVVGDGSEGLPQEAPFDAVVVSAAYPKRAGSAWPPSSPLRAGSCSRSGRAAARRSFCSKRGPGRARSPACGHGRALRPSGRKARVRAQ